MHLQPWCFVTLKLIITVHVLHEFFHIQKRPLIRNFIVSGNGILGKLTKVLCAKAQQSLSVNIPVDTITRLAEPINLNYPCLYRRQDYHVFSVDRCSWRNKQLHNWSMAMLCCHVQWGSVNLSGMIMQEGLTRKNLTRPTFITNVHNNNNHFYLNTISIQSTSACGVVYKT